MVSALLHENLRFHAASYLDFHARAAMPRDTRSCASYRDGTRGYLPAAFEEVSSHRVSTSVRPDQCTLDKAETLRTKGNPVITTYMHGLHEAVTTTGERKLATSISSCLCERRHQPQRKDIAARPSGPDTRTSCDVCLSHPVQTFLFDFNWERGVPNGGT